MRELALWQKLRHPNIVQFLGVLSNSDRLIFLIEYLRNVSIIDAILRHRPFLFPNLYLNDFPPIEHVREVCMTY